MKPLMLCAVLAWARPAAAAEVHVAWAYDGLPPAMRIHELSGTPPELWTTQVVAGLAEAPVGPEIAGSDVSLEPGQTRTFALVYENRTRETLRFFAAPHSAEPAPATLGFKFKCLCTNHVYQVPPGKVWYRVVQLRLARSYAGKRVEVKHHLVALDAAQARDFAGHAAMEDHQHD